MNKYILLINSQPNVYEPLLDFLKELASRQFNLFCFWVKSDHSARDLLSANNWLNKKVYLGPDISGLTHAQKPRTMNSLAFLLALPFLIIKFFAILSYFKFFKNIKTIICWHGNEKLIITPAALILNIKIVWVECPNLNYQAQSRLISWPYKKLANLAQVVCLTNLTKKRLNHLGAKPERIAQVNLGIKPHDYQRQETIFDSLAHRGLDKSGRKFFTVGTVVDLDKQQRIEVLFYAVKKCLAVIPNIQLIIIGEGEEKKNLAWLAKKLEIDGIVWFIGQQKYTGKWLDSFDVFVAGARSLNINTLKLYLQAMAAGLPVIGLRDIGLEDLIVEDKTGMLPLVNDNESLARHIIKLEQNRPLRIKMGKNAQDKVDRHFSLNKMVEEFEKIIDIK